MIIVALRREHALAPPEAVHHLHVEELTVGRAADNTLAIDDLRASRHHLRLWCDDEGWQAEDLGSRHGTLLNGQPLRGPARLSPADALTIGTTVLVVTPGATPGARNGAGSWTEMPTEDGPPATAPAAFVGGSSATRAVLDLARRVAPTTVPVLLEGETGTGKELLARLIHDMSGKAEGSLVVVNCPALPEGLADSELFGVESGVATGVEARSGRLATADGGTLLLDEVGDLASDVQAKLLRFLEDGTADRVGGSGPVRHDVRVIAATNLDLDVAVANGRFRQDLYHRLAGFRIAVPPLRDRSEDIPSLVEHFLRHDEGHAVSFSADALAALGKHDFPGNVRELRQAVRHARVMASGPVVELEHLPLALQREAAAGGSLTARDLWRLIVEESEPFWDLVHAPYLRRELSREVVMELVRRAWEESGRSYAASARTLGIGDEARKYTDFLKHHRLGPTHG